MINLLIVEDDFVQAKNLSNYISYNLPDVRIYNISTDGSSALSVIKNSEIDLILLDLNIPNITGINILNYIEANHLEKYKKSIIIVTGEMEIAKQIAHNNYIFAFNYKSCGLQPILNNIRLWKQNKLDTAKFLSARRIVIHNLENLKYNLSHIGTTYLIDTIMELYIRDEKTISNNLTKTIYPIIANRYNKSINNIKSNITRSTINMYLNCPEEKLKQFLDLNIIVEQPKTKEIIYKILYILKKEDQNVI